MKSAAFFWFHRPKVEHDEGEAGEADPSEDPDGKAVEQPEASSGRRLIEQGSKRLDFRGEEEPRDERAEAHQGGEGDPPDALAEAHGNPRKNEARCHTSPIQWG
jgi:hypothetical protein